MIKSKPKYYSVLLLGLVLLLASSLMGCATKPPVIDQFNASLSQITVGESTTLRWRVSDATTIRIDQGIGIVPANGSLSVSPSSTIAYTLTATNDAATVTKSVVITVKGVSPTPTPPGESVISALDTNKLLDIGYNHPEKVVIVEGIIVGTYYAKGSKGQPTFLNFHDPYQGYFTALIWGSDRANFPPNPESYYLHKKVRVKGKIEIYKGAPEIILRQSSQIWTVN